jgi:hypothetical protein
MYYTICVSFYECLKVQAFKNLYYEIKIINLSEFRICSLNDLQLQTIIYYYFNYGSMYISLTH